MFYFTLLYVVALCVKMRYVILGIKRLLIDWLRFYCVVEQMVSEHWRKYTALTPTSGLAKLFI